MEPKKEPTTFKGPGGLAVRVLDLIRMQVHNRGGTFSFETGSRRLLPFPFFASEQTEVQVASFLMLSPV